MLQFIHDLLPSRVVFGAGSLAQLPDAAMRLGANHALVLCTPSTPTASRCACWPTTPTATSAPPTRTTR